VLAAPSPSTYEALLAEQEAWATQSDKRTVEFLSVLAASGGKAIGNAGARQSEQDVTCLAVHLSPLWRSTDQVSWRRRLREGLLCRSAQALPVSPSRQDLQMQCQRAAQKLPR